MSEKKAPEVNEPEVKEVLELVSPSGHKYEIRVTDAGTLATEYKGKSE